MLSEDRKLAWAAVIVAAVAVLEVGYYLASPSQLPSTPRPVAYSENGDSSENTDRETKDVSRLKLANGQEARQERQWEADYQQKKMADERNAGIGIAAIIVGLAQAVALFITFIVIAVVAIRQLRAYIYPAVALENFSIPGPIRFVATMRNNGATPARDFESNTAGFIGMLPLGDDATIGEPAEDPLIKRHSKLTVYPQTEHKSAFNLEVPLTDEAIDALMEMPRPKIALYATGEARYRDVFGFKRKTQFCRYIEPADTRAFLVHFRSGGPIPTEVRFVAAHVCNKFT